jgi:hypothetical protein
MKQFLILIVFFFSLFKVNGQSYFPFPDSNCVWSVEQEKHLIKGDSVYNSIAYKKYYITTDTNLTEASLQFVGLVRQDKPNKKVFGIARTDTMEALMYDFNLNINDTTTVKPLIDWYGITDKRLKVSAKDSVVINGQYRKRLTLTPNDGMDWPEEIWIEGIGSCFGPLSPGLIYQQVICPCYPTLLCQKVDTVTEYINPDYNSCYKAVCFGVGINKLNKTNAIKIYPNPTSDILYIDINEKVKSVSIYNLDGQLVSALNFNEANKTVNFSKLERGFYFIKVSTPYETLNAKVILSDN